jgi:hypothetical protein
MTRQRRLDALEAALWRHMVAEMCEGTPVTPQALLDEAIRVFSLPRDAQRVWGPEFTDTQFDEALTWLPAIRRARLLTP